MFALSAGNCGDAQEGRALLRRLGPVNQPVYLLMDRAYEGDDTRALAVELGYIPVVPPKSNRKNPWDYDKQLYRQRAKTAPFTAFFITCPSLRTW